MLEIIYTKSVNYHINNILLFIVLHLEKANFFDIRHHRTLCVVPNDCKVFLYEISFTHYFLCILFHCLLLLLSLLLLLFFPFYYCYFLASMNFFHIFNLIYCHKSEMLARLLMRHYISLQCHSFYLPYPIKPWYTVGKIYMRMCKSVHLFAY